MRPIIQKRARYENRRLLDQAHDAPCFAQFTHQCTGHEGCEPSHPNWQIWGRGAFYKPSDCFYASLCHVAHDMIDNKLNKALTDEEREVEWLRAYVATQEWLWENKRIRVA